MPTLALPLGAATLSTPAPLGPGPELLAFNGPFPGAALQTMLVMLLVFGGFYLAVKILAGVGGLIGGLFRAVGRLVRHVFGTLGAIVQDTFRSVGSVATGAFYLPVALGSVALGRWSAARHFARAAQQELKGAVLATYRVGVSHPLKLFGVHALVEGFEQRLPEVLAEAPGRDRPRGGKRAFEGYEVIGSLPPGGSGAQLYHARPTAAKRETYGTHGLKLPDEVVIKCFDLQGGSTLPQIVRENRALQAARSLGLVLEHELSPTRFHYVMPFVPGQDLSQVARGLHARAGSEGLSNVAMRAAMGYTAGLLEILERFHGAGLWHKDIKPSNVIVNGERVELVDLGLVTPLASALTLTTHGTEYYRDPEMVRLAMQGVKVHEVDGVKFDLYSVGAVLYGLIENSFPAHGSLSRIGKRCPEALKFVVQRAMADLKDRYANASAMLADLRVLLAAADPFQVRPVDLPSLGGKPRAQAAAAPAAWAPLAGINPAGKTPPPLPNRLAAAGFANVPPLPSSQRAVAGKSSGSRFVAAVGGVLMALFVASGIFMVRDHEQRREAVREQRFAQERYAQAARAEMVAASKGRGPARSTRNGQTLALAPAAPPAGPLLLVLRTPQALPTDVELELATELGAALNTRVISERQVEQAEDLRWAASVRHLVQLSDLANVGPDNPLEGYLRAEPELGAVLWIDPAGSGQQLNYLWVSRVGDSTTRIAGRSTRGNLPKALAQQPAVQARFYVGQRGPAPASAAAFAPLAPLTIEDAIFSRSPSGRRQVQRAIEMARERQESLRESLAARAEARKEEFERWAEEFSQEFECWGEDLGERFECWAEELEEQLEAHLDAAGHSLEQGLEAARVFPR